MSIFRPLKLNPGLLSRCCLLGMSLALLRAGAADLYVAADGTPSGPGTLSEPYDLKTALSGSVGMPGDTFWLRGGTYSLGHVDTKIHGEAGNPITFHQMPGERARVDGSFTVWDSIGHVIFRDFELFNSNPERISSQLGMGFKPTDIEITPGIQSYAPNFSFINLAIHDHGRHGIYVSQQSDGNLIHGCVIYNNGYRAPDNSEGHGVYIQGSSGMREVSDNLLFNCAGVGMHVYDNGGPPLEGVTIDGNVVFNSGALQNVRRYWDWVIGVDPPSRYADRIVFKNNLGYLPPDSRAYRRVEIGRDGLNGTLTLTGNYLPLRLLMNNWTTATVTGNTFAPRDMDYAVELQQGTNQLTATWNDNLYASPTIEKDFRHNSTDYTFSEWKSLTGYDASSTHIAGGLTGTKVFVRPNRHEEGRAHIIVYNWSGEDVVSVDVSAVLPEGTPYEVRNAQDFFAAPVLSGTFDGQPLPLPMRGLTVAAPIGDMLTPPPTGPTFNVFVLLPWPGPKNSNTAPTISPVESQTATAGTMTAPISFTVSDAETAAGSLTVSGRSSNPALIPNDSIVLGGSGSIRTVSVTPTPDRTGVATLTLAVSDGSLSSNTKLVVKVNPPLTTGLTLGADSGDISAPFIVTEGAVAQPDYTTLDAGGRAAYTFRLRTPGDYVVSALVNAPDEGANSLYVNIDAEPDGPAMIWDIPVSGEWTEATVSWRGSGTHESNQFAPKVFELDAGTHQLIVRGREARCQFSTFVIATYEAIPPTVSITSSDTTATEGTNDTASFTLTRTGAPATDLTVTLAPGGSATKGDDYRRLLEGDMPDEWTIPAGSSSVTITVMAVDDGLVEGTETAALSIQPGDPYHVGTPGHVTLTLLDNPNTNAVQPTVTAVAFDGNAIRITWTSEPGKVYRVAHKSRITDPVWVDLGGEIAATGNSTTWTDDSPEPASHGFYMVYGVE